MGAPRYPPTAEVLHAGLRLALPFFFATLTVLVISLSAQRSSAVPIRNAGAATPSYTSHSFGYAIDLPVGWRRSGLLSKTIVGDRLFLGHDVFTQRSVAEEAALARPDVWLGPAWQWTVIVIAYNNAEGLTPEAWANSRHAGFSVAQRIEAATFQGLRAVKVTDGAILSVSYYVARGQNMYLIGYMKHALITIPGVDEALLSSILATFRFTQ